ncbi:MULTISPECIES: hypothetical protein [Rhizobium]|uniref:hypothetical protein n=2 Tax=Rhizobium/Agrobacterium group TaxID=227290 RepID=UPI001FD9E5F3|nr:MULTISPECIES: hypothetical protein [Rhizobium]
MRESGPPRQHLDRLSVYQEAHRRALTFGATARGLSVPVSHYRGIRPQCSLNTAQYLKQFGNLGKTDAGREEPGKHSGLLANIDRSYPSANHLQMSYTADFISELTRAANEVDELSTDEYRRLVERAVRMVREMRLETGTRPSRGNYVAMGDLEIAALMTEAAANNDEVEGVLLNLAGMIRALNIMVDGKIDVRKGD